MVEVCGLYEDVMGGLTELPPTTTSLSVTSADKKPIPLNSSLAQRGILLTKLSLRNVNISQSDEEEGNGVEKLPGKRRISQFVQRGTSEEETKRISDQKDKIEFDIFKKVFQNLSSLVFLDIVNGHGVLTEPVRYLKSLHTVLPSLETLKISKVFKKEATNDDLLMITGETMASLAELKHLKCLHLEGFAGRQNRFSHYYYTMLDDSISRIAQNGILEDFLFTQSGMTYKGVFELLRFCKNLRRVSVTGRFGKPGLFMLHKHNVPFLSLTEHHADSALYTCSHRDLSLSLTNLLQDEKRYDPDWVDDPFPEDRVEE